MRVSREQVAENRRAILAAAGRLFRERGFATVTVAEVMKAAGLTHGAFYGYFSSKNALAREACAMAAAPEAPAPDAPTSLSGYADLYLTPSHRDAPGTGCVFAALGGEAAREAPEIRHAMTQGLRERLVRLAATAPGPTEDARRRAAVAAFSAMVGGLLLARLVDDPDLSAEILQANRNAPGPDHAEDPATCP